MITKTVTGAVNQILCMDGTTAVLDAIHALAFTKTGGVGNAWPGDSSNFRTLLGASAPVIAQTNDNLLSDENASFEGNTVGNWGGLLNCTFAASTDFAYHGTHSAKMITTANGLARPFLTVTAVTSNVQTTYSARFKGVVGRRYLLAMNGDVSGMTTGTSVTADGTWQTVTVTKTWAGDTARYIYLFADAAALAGDIVYWDAIQLETGAVATPFALDYRTGGYCRIANPLTVGGDASFVFLVNGPWAGNDGIEHTLFSASGAGAGDVYRLYKGTDNKLYFAVGDKSAVTAALTTTTWAANVNKVVIGTVAGGTINVYLAGTAGTPATGATREAALNANLYVGTKTDGTLPVNAAILGAAYGRVLTSGERTALSVPATWASVIDLPQITVTGLATGNAVRLYDSAGNIHASAVETGGTATLTYTLD